MVAHLKAPKIRGEKEKMFRKIGPVLTSALIALAILMTIPNVALANPSNPPKNPYEFIEDVATGGGPHTLETSMAFDPPSGEVIQNVMEGLIFWEGEPYDVFTPLLATQVWVAPPDPAAPAYTNYTIYFKIRVGAPFQNHTRVDEPFSWDQYYLTTDDVQYSFYRGMVHDYFDSAWYMMWDPLLGVGASNASDPAFATKIQGAVQKNDTYVWFNIANPGETPATTIPSFAPVPLFATEGGVQSPTFWSSVGSLPTSYPLRIMFQLLAMPWFEIMSKQWILNFVIPYGIAHSIDMNPSVPGIQVDWDGNFSDWTDYNRWSASPLDKIGTLHPGVIMGTGPYILDRYDPTDGGEWSVVKNDAYWGGWPASFPSPPYSPQSSSGIKPAGYVTRLTVRQRDTSTMISELVSGDCDLINEASLSESLYGQLHVGGDRNAATLSGMRLDYPVFPLRIDSIEPTFNISATADNKFGKIYPDNSLAEDGIPSNFFADIHVRRAIGYLINYTSAINDVWLGDAYPLITCCPNGIAYVNPNQAHFTLNVPAGINELNQAFGGNLATTGFTLTMCYASARDYDRALMEDLAARLNTIGTSNFGGKFHVTTVGLSWADLFPAWSARSMPIWAMGWTMDYADVHDMFLPYMASTGVYGGLFQGYSNSTVDALVSAGTRTPDGPLRQAIYYQLESIYYDQAISFPVLGGIYRMYSRTWVAGMFYNPLYIEQVYAYYLWKWDYLQGNVNFDDKVSMDDIMLTLSAFGSYSGKSGQPALSPTWNFYCDQMGNPLSGWRDRKIDMYDVIVALNTFGKADTVWVPPS
jgi:ABC-type oligopeptide transport system substrate-binding subunit